MGIPYQTYIRLFIYMVLLVGFGQVRVLWEAGTIQDTTSVDPSHYMAEPVTSRPLLGPKGLKWAHLALLWVLLVGLAQVTVLWATGTIQNTSLVVPSHYMADPVTSRFLMGPKGLKWALLWVLLVGLGQVRVLWAPGTIQDTSLSLVVWSPEGIDYRSRSLDSCLLNSCQTTSRLIRE